MKLKRFVAACGIAALFVVGCSTSTGTPVSDDVSFETFNVALAGAYVPNVAVRRPELLKALAQRTSDIICIQEAWEQADKDAIIAAAKDSYPHIATVRQNDDSVVSDRVALDGKEPPELTDAPCANHQPKLNVALNCVTDSVWGEEFVDSGKSCVSIPGSEDATVLSTECVSKACVRQVGSLIYGADDAKRCYGCVAPLLSGTKLSQIRSICTTNPKGGLAYGGQDGVMILSRFPLSNITAYVLPSTWTRRTILHADATLPNGTVGIYCNHLSPIFNGEADPTLTYTGQYGADASGKEATGKDAWANEQLLQAKQLVAYVTKTSGNGRAVILGDFNASRTDVAAGISLKGGDGLATLDTLEQAFTPAVAANFKPECTFCTTNPNMTLADVADDSKSIDRIYMKSIAATAVTSTAVTRKAATIDGVNEADDNKPVKVPLSDHYGLQSVITMK